MHLKAITPNVHTCQFCGREFQPIPRSKGLFCSRPCWRAQEAASRPTTTCQVCGQLFAAEARLIAAGQAKFCSRTCYANGRTRRPLVERFWAKVDKQGSIPAHRPDLGLCWIWTGYCDPNGYGRCALETTKPKLATHVSWFLAHGYWPKAALHHCDNPPCVRPDHLFEGDQAANMADAARKRRTTFGERSSSVKLTEVQVIEIRRRVAAGERRTSIAAAYGISRATIGDIVLRKIWAHLDA